MVLLAQYKFSPNPLAISGAVAAYSPTTALDSSPIPSVPVLHENVETVVQNIPRPLAPREQRLNDISQVLSRYLMQNLATQAQSRGEQIGERDLQTRVEAAISPLFQSFDASTNTLLPLQTNSPLLQDLLHSDLPVHRAFQRYLQTVSHLDLSDREYHQAKLQLIRSLAQQSGGAAGETIQLASALERTVRGAFWSVGENKEANQAALEQALYRLSDRCEEWASHSHSSQRAQENEGYLELANSLAQEMLREVQGPESDIRSELNELLQQEIPWRAGERELSQILREHSLVFCRDKWETSTALIGMIAAVGGGWCGLIAKNRLLSALIGGAANGGIQTGLQLVRQLMQQGKLQGPPVGIQVIQSLSTGAACGVVGHALGLGFFKLHKISWLSALGQSGLREFRFGLARFAEKQFRFWLDVGTEIGCDEVWGSRNIQNRMGIHNAPQPPLILRGGVSDPSLSERRDQEMDPIQTHPFFKWINNAAGEVCGDLYGEMAHHYTHQVIHFDQALLVSRILHDYAPVFEHLGKMETEAHQVLVSFLQAYEGDGGSREELIGRVLQLVVRGDSDLRQNDKDTPDALLVVTDIHNVIHATGSDSSFKAAQQNIQRDRDLFFSKAQFTNVSPKMTQLVEGYFASIFSAKDRVKVLKASSKLGTRVGALLAAPASGVKLPIIGLPHRDTFTDKLGSAPHNDRVEKLLQRLLFNEAGPSLKVERNLKRLERAWNVRKTIVASLVNSPELQNHFTFHLLQETRFLKNKAQKLWTQIKSTYSDYYHTDGLATAQASAAVYRQVQLVPILTQFSNFIFEQASPLAIPPQQLLKGIQQGKWSLEFLDGKLKLIENEFVTQKSEAKKDQGQSERENSGQESSQEKAEEKFECTQGHPLPNPLPSKGEGNSFAAPVLTALAVGLGVFLDVTSSVAHAAAEFTSHLGALQVSHSLVAVVASLFGVWAIAAAVKAAEEVPRIILSFDSAQQVFELGKNIAPDDAQATAREAEIYREEGKYFLEALYRNNEKGRLPLFVLHPDTKEWMMAGDREEIELCSGMQFSIGSRVYEFREQSETVTLSPIPLAQEKFEVLAGQTPLLHAEYSQKGPFVEAPPEIPEDLIMRVIVSAKHKSEAGDSYAARSEIGFTHIDKNVRNQDQFLRIELADRILTVVLDGVGGYKDSERASALAVIGIDWVYKHGGSFSQAVLLARQLIQRDNKINNPSATALLLQEVRRMEDGSKAVTTLSLGDCEAYVLEEGSEESWNFLCASIAAPEKTHELSEQVLKGQHLLSKEQKLLTCLNPENHCLNTALGVHFPFVPSVQRSRSRKALLTVACSDGVGEMLARAEEWVSLFRLAVQQGYQNLQQRLDFIFLGLKIRNFLYLTVDTQGRPLNQDENEIFDAAPRHIALRYNADFISLFDLSPEALQKCVAESLWADQIPAGQDLLGLPLQEDLLLIRFKKPSQFIDKILYEVHLPKSAFIIRRKDLGQFFELVFQPPQDEVSYLKMAQVIVSTIKYGDDETLALEYFPVDEAALQAHAVRERARQIQGSLLEKNQQGESIATLQSPMGLCFKVVVRDGGRLTLSAEDSEWMRLQVYNLATLPLDADLASEECLFLKALALLHDGVAVSSEKRSLKTPPVNIHQAYEGAKRGEEKACAFFEEQLRKKDLDEERATLLLDTLEKLATQKAYEILSNFVKEYADRNRPVLRGRFIHGKIFQG